MSLLFTKDLTKEWRIYVFQDRIMLEYIPYSFNIFHDELKRINDALDETPYNTKVSFSLDDLWSIKAYRNECYIVMEWYEKFEAEEEWSKEFEFKIPILVWEEILGYISMYEL